MMDRPAQQSPAHIAFVKDGSVATGDRKQRATKGAKNGAGGTATNSQQPKKRGRPSNFTADLLDKAKKLAAKGFTDAEVADFFGIPRTQLYRWINANPEFGDALKLGKQEADQRVERSLYERACGYSHPEVHVSNYQGEVTLTPITKVYPPDTTAGIFWLKNRRPAEWREKVDHTLANPDGSPLLSLLAKMGSSSFPVKDDG